MMSVARELYGLADDLRQKSKDGKSMNATQLGELSEFMTSLARLAHLDEQELSVFRLGEAGQLGRAAVNELATEAMGKMLLDQNIVRPDFGRKG